MWYCGVNGLLGSFSINEGVVSDKMELEVKNGDDNTVWLCQHNPFNSKTVATVDGHGNLSLYEQYSFLFLYFSISIFYFLFSISISIFYFLFSIFFFLFSFFFFLFSFFLTIFFIIYNAKREDKQMKLLDRSNVSKYPLTCLNWSSDLNGLIVSSDLGRNLAVHYTNQ